uniref:Uncharacterized protein n=1 Tax=Anguilla anguilla TaxID=7936 RepID=A0A0E9SDA1_ANGAN
MATSAAIVIRVGHLLHIGCARESGSARLCYLSLG